MINKIPMPKGYKQLKYPISVEVKATNLDVDVFEDGGNLVGRLLMDIPVGKSVQLSVVYAKKYSNGEKMTFESTEYLDSTNKIFGLAKFPYVNTSDRYVEHVDISITEV